MSGGRSSGGISPGKRMRPVRPAAAMRCSRPARKAASDLAARPMTRAVRPGWFGSSFIMASTKRSVPFSGRMRPMVAMPAVPGWPVAAQAAARSVAGVKRAVSTPWGTVARTWGTKVAAFSVVAITASMREMSQRGMAEWRRMAAEVKTIFTGRRRMSRAQRAARISGLRRTCQMVKGRFSGFVRERRRASRRVTGVGQPGRGWPARTMSNREACCRMTPAAVAETPVKLGLKLVTMSSGKGGALVGVAPA